MDSLAFRQTHFALDLDIDRAAYTRADVNNQLAALHREKRAQKLDKKIQKSNRAIFLID